MTSGAPRPRRTVVEKFEATVKREEIGSAWLGPGYRVICEAGMRMEAGVIVNRCTGRAERDVIREDHMITMIMCDVGRVRRAACGPWWLVGRVLVKMS